MKSAALKDYNVDYDIEALVHEQIKPITEQASRELSDPSARLMVITQALKARHRDNDNAAVMIGIMQAFADDDESDETVFFPQLRAAMMIAQQEFSQRFGPLLRTQLTAAKKATEEMHESGKVQDWSLSDADQKVLESATDDLVATCQINHIPVIITYPVAQKGGQTTMRTLAIEPQGRKFAPPFEVLETVLGKDGFDRAIERCGSGSDMGALMEALKDLVAERNGAEDKEPERLH